ncbi:MAG: hypothetical protein NZ519_05445 [Bacteroidia bacterium]|nr:hypothetical protein [Bacteroidia bacterium]
MGASLRLSLQGQRTVGYMRNTPTLRSKGYAQKTIKFQLLTA